MYAWNDRNRIHILSTADTTLTNTVTKKKMRIYNFRVQYSYENIMKNWGVLIDSISLCH